MHSPLHIQERLKGGQNLVTFTGSPFNLKITRHKRFLNLVQFKYDQIHSPLNSALVQQCRGLILDEAENWRVISRPFDKFFNYGEPLAPELDWKGKVKVYEKCDGSMIQMFCYKGEWWVGTTGTPDASGMVGDHGLTFEELFWKTWKRMEFGTLPMAHESHQTFLFELMTPLNRVVVDHKHHTLQLLGVRSRDSGDELPPKFWPHFNPVKVFDLNSIDDIILTMTNMDPLKQEGYVVVDSRDNRVKVKHPGYVKLHHTVSSMSERNLLDIIRNNESGEVICAFPECKEEFDRLTKSYTHLIAEVYKVWDTYKNLDTPKDFAMAVHTYPFCQILFMMRNGKVNTVGEACRILHVDRVLELMKRTGSRVPA